MRRYALYRVPVLVTLYFDACKFNWELCEHGVWILSVIITICSVYYHSWVHQWKHMLWYIHNPDGTQKKHLLMHFSDSLELVGIIAETYAFSPFITKGRKGSILGYIIHVPQLFPLLPGNKLEVIRCYGLNKNVCHVRTRLCSLKKKKERTNNMERCITWMIKAEIPPCGLRDVLLWCMRFSFYQPHDGEAFTYGIGGCLIVTWKPWNLLGIFRWIQTHILTVLMCEPCGLRDHTRLNVINKYATSDIWAA